MYRVLCCGDRNWSDAEKIKQRLMLVTREAIIIHGNASGADRMSASIAKDLGFKAIESYPANWAEFH